MLGFESRPGRVSACRIRLTKLCAVHIEYGRSTPSLADFAVYGSLSPLLIIGESIPAEFPRLAACSVRIQSLGR